MTRARPDEMSRPQNARDISNLCWLRTIALPVAIAALTVSTGASGQGQPATVGVATVEKRQVSDTRPVIGQLMASTEAHVATRTAGIVSDVLFAIGDDVAKGAVLVRLDKGRLELERNSARAEVKVAEAGTSVAQADVRRAKQAFDRQAALRRSRAFSRGRYEDLEQDVAKAEAALLRSNAELARAQTRVAEVDYRIKHAEILAPFDGIIIEKQAQPGAYMQIGSAIATIMDVANLEVEADVPAELVSGLTPGRAVTIRFDDGTTSTARVRALIPVQTVATRTRPVRFSADLSGITLQRIARGKSLTLDIPTGRPREELTVPKDALVQAGTGWRVFAVADGKAVPKRVEIGAAVGDRMIVLSGLSAGATVVVRGNERLRPGQAVRVPEQASPKETAKPKSQAKEDGRPKSVPRRTRS